VRIRNATPYREIKRERERERECVLGTLLDIYIERGRLCIRNATPCRERERERARARAREREY
jgi:hypothetical protein